MATKKLVARVVSTCCPSLLTDTLSDSDASDLADAFAALADPVRVKLVNLLATTLAQQGEVGEMCACDLIEPLERSQPTVSHHCKILVDAGLIIGEKRGRWVWYRIVPERLAELRQTLAG
jgi:ArsR family transcriptional regulator